MLLLPFKSRKRKRNPKKSTSIPSNPLQNPHHSKSLNHQPPPPMAENTDRFSLLSDDLILTIILLLPTKQSISLSALSRRFRHIPALLPRRDTACPTSPNAFLLRRLHLTSSPNQPQLIQAAAGRGVKEISVHLPANTTAKPVPGNLFAVTSLTVLSLRNVKIPCSVQKDISTLPLLRTLKLDRVVMLGRVLEKVLDSVPVVENLEMLYCVAVDRCEIRGDRLRSLVFRPSLGQREVKVEAKELRTLTLYTRPKIRKVELMPSPEVRKVYLHISKTGVKLECKLRPFIEAATGMVTLQLRGIAMKLLSSEYKEVNKLPVSFEAMRILSVSLDFSVGYEVLFLVKLLESCPSLKELNLSASDDRKEKSMPKFSEHVERLRQIPCLSNHLKQVQFSGFKPESYEKELLKLLLREAKVMKKMRLQFPKAHVETVKQIVAVRKASFQKMSTHRSDRCMELDF